MKLCGSALPHRSDDAKIFQHIYLWYPILGSDSEAPDAAGFQQLVGFHNADAKHLCKITGCDHVGIFGENILIYFLSVQVCLLISRLYKFILRS